jgi:2-iminobutanoate/2-iminopropanoate deaminase
MHVDPIPMGIRIGRYLFSSRIMGTDPGTGRSAPDLETHTALCVQHLQTLVQGAGASMSDLTQAIAFVKQPEDGRYLSELWPKLFPNDAERPMLRLLTTDLPGLVIRMEVMGVLDHADA